MQLRFSLIFVVALVDESSAEEDPPPPSILGVILDVIVIRSLVEPVVFKPSASILTDTVDLLI